MPNEAPSDSASDRPISVLVLAWPIGLLLLEATALTPFVEFRAGGMSWLASPFFLTAGIVAVAAFMLIVVATAVPHPPSTEASKSSPSTLAWLLMPWKKMRRGWAGVHLACLALFFWWSIVLNAKAANGGVSWWLSATWLILGAAVALSIMLAFLPLRSVFTIARQHLWQAGVAAAVGVALIMMTPIVRDYWPDVDDPGLEVLHVLLTIYPGESIINTASNRWPIIGTSRISLLVTPACSELDSLLVFVLLAGTLWAARAERLSLTKYLAVVALGLAGMYLLLALRLYFMILIGYWTHDPYVAVKFAHSRLTTLALLFYSLAVLYVGSQVARPTIRSEEDPTALETEQAETENAPSHEAALEPSTSS